MLISSSLLDRECTDPFWVVSMPDFAGGKWVSKKLSWLLSWLLLLDDPGIGVPGSGLPLYVWNGNANAEGGGR